MLNIYTVSEEELAGLEKIGPSLVQRIVDLGAKVTNMSRCRVMDLAKIRLPADYWQGLIDAGTLSIQMPPTSRPKLKPVSVPSDTMKEVMNESKELHAKYDHMERKCTKEGEETHRQFTSIGNYLSEYGPCLDVMVNNTKVHLQRVDNLEETLAGLTRFLEKLDKRLDRQEASISSLDKGQEFGSGVSRQEPEPQNELDQLGKMAEETEPLTSVNSVFSRIKMALPADGIYSAKGSAVPSTSFLGGMYSSKDDERLDSTRGNSITRGRSRQRRNKEKGSVTDSDRSLSPLPPKMQIFSEDQT